MKNIVVNLLCLFLVVSLSVTTGYSQSNGKIKTEQKKSKKPKAELVPSPPPVSPCERVFIVNMSQLDDGMNNIETCGGVRACTGNNTFSEFENDSFVVLDHSNHSNNGQGFNIQLQDALYEQSKILGNEQAPLCGNENKKSIYKIVFTYGTYQSSTGTRYRIEANITYGCCTGVRDH